MFKNVLSAVVSVLVPFIYTALIEEYPDFPLAQVEFIEAIVWIVGLVVGGWNIKSARLIYLEKK